MKTRAKVEAADEVLTGELFDAMTARQRAKIVAEIEAESPRQRIARSRPMNARERERWERVRKNMGRPKLGKDGTKIVSVTVEKSLLKQADTFAKAQGMKRSELFARSVRQAMRDGLKAG
jgi:hypothetical protein